MSVSHNQKAAAMGSFSGRGKDGSLVAKVLSFVSNNPGKVKSAIAKAGGFINKRTHGKYSRQIIAVQTKASQAVDRTHRKYGPDGSNFR